MMSKVSAIIGSAVFLVIAPGFVAGLVPWWISRWRLKPALFGLPSLRVAGSVLIVLGMIGLFDSFTRFAVQGVGSPARLPNPSFSCHWTVSLCPKSDVHGSGEHNSRSGLDAREYSAS